MKVKEYYEDLESERLESYLRAENELLTDELNSLCDEIADFVENINSNWPPYIAARIRERYKR